MSSGWKNGSLKERERKRKEIYVLEWVGKENCKMRPEGRERGLESYVGSLRRKFGWVALETELEKLFALTFSNFF